MSSEDVEPSLTDTEMVLNRNLRIGAIFVTSFASIVGFALPHFRRIQKESDGSLKISSVLLSLKAFSAGVILSVALIHLLNDAIETLDELQVVEFPLALTLAVLGAALTLGIELLSISMMTGVNNSYDSSLQMVNNNGIETKIAIYSSPTTSATISADTATTSANTATNAAAATVAAAAAAAATPPSCSVTIFDCVDVKGDDNINNKAAGGLDDNNHLAHVHSHSMASDVGDPTKAIIKTMILEGCIALHSVVIGVSLGAMADAKPSGISTLMAAFAFHQFF